MSDPLVRLTTALSRNYTVERELGAGGMATEFAADIKDAQSRGYLGP